MTQRTQSKSILQATIHTGTQQGFTLVELIVVVAIIGLLATIAIPAFEEQVKSAKRARAIGDIRTIDKEIQAFIIDKNRPPINLAELGKGVFVDGYGRAYEYSNTAVLEDEYGDPHNTDYDLYSKGPDGVSDSIYTAATCADDIVRRSDGIYVGPRDISLF